MTAAKDPSAAAEGSNLAATGDVTSDGTQLPQGAVRPRHVTVEKLGYSSRPWRLIDSLTGLEVTVEHEEFNHWQLGAMSLPVCGYNTKSDAVDALGRLAARALPEAV